MQRADRPPFGLDAALPAFRRSTWLAKTLFEAADASITLLDGDRVWRSRDPGDLSLDDPGARRVIETGELLWIEDGSSEAEFADDPLVVRYGVRFYAGAPVTLGDGSTPGVLCVVDTRPRAYDEKLARALRELAQGVADECERAKAAEAAAQAAAELDRTRSVLAAFVEGVPVSIFMTDREFRLLKASPRWLEAFQVKAQEVEGRSVFDIDPVYFGKFRTAFEKVMSGRALRDPKVWSEHNGYGNWIQSELTPWRDDRGEIGGIIVSAHVITDMVSALERAERSEQRLKLAMEIAEVHVFDIDYKAQTVEKAGPEEAFFERPQSFDDIAGDHLHMVVPEERERVRRQRRESYYATGVAKSEFKIRRTDGKDVWAETAANVFRDDAGKTLRVVGAMRNITSHKVAERALLHAKEEAEAANRAKSTFLATMSHEIRTPLNGVLGMAQAMAADELAENQRERLMVIRESGETLLAILNDVLDLSKIEAGKLELEEAEFDVAELARGAHGAFTAIAHKKGLSFDLAVEQKARGVYRGDSTRVRQILYNLVSNALKFTHEGEVRVCVSGEDEGLTIRVSDTGIGIPADRLAALFQKFEQADASTTRRYGGTGLGLAICRELASLMGGSIRAESEEGEGTVFTVELPLPRVGDAIERPADAPGAAVRAEFEAPAIRLLAAEDNQVNQLVLKTLLAQAGIEPVVVGNGRLAVEAWKGGEWDVILMDVQMPEMDGPTAARLIRQKEAASGRRRTPIIALTANAMAHQVLDYASAGMDTFVPKPIEIGRLFSALQEVLDAADDQGPKVEVA